MGKTKKFPFKMGADPEFAFVCKENKISAAHLLEEALDKEIIRSETVSGAGEFGEDGHDSTGEFRPTPSDNPYKLANNIGKLVKVVSKISPIIDITTISTQNDPLGGHIHFELQEQETALTDTQINNIKKIMAIFYIPVMVGEDLGNKKQRLRCDYGKVRDHKIHVPGPSWPNGNRVRTLEFRCPNAEWIISEKIAASTLAYFGTVYNEIINHRDNAVKDKDLITMMQSQIDAIEMLAVSKYCFVTKKMIEAIRKSIKTFELYDDFKDEIDFILSPQKVMKEKQAINFSAKRGWIDDDKKYSKEDFSEVKKELTRREEKLLELSEGLLRINRNAGDINLSLFSKILARQMTLKGSEPKNEYFLFGLSGNKKGFLIAKEDYSIIEGERMLKCEEDREAMRTLISKMINKYYDNRGNRTNKDRQTILIGIPYKNRVDKNYKKFLGRVWDLENRPIKSKQLNEIKIENTGRPNKNLKETS